MAEEKLKIYHVRTSDGSLHTVEALYAFNNDDKGGSLIFRVVEGDRKPVVAEFARGCWQWYQLATKREPKPDMDWNGGKLDVDTELGIGAEHLPPRGYKDDGKDDNYTP